jgi:hypothetical protein
MESVMTVNAVKSRLKLERPSNSEFKEVKGKSNEFGEDETKRSPWTQLQGEQCTKSIEVVFR